MTTTSKTSTPESTRLALEGMVRREALAAGQDMSHFRQRLLFERFLGRVFVAMGERTLVTGGALVQLRLDKSRTTKDVNLIMSGDPEALRGELEAALKADLGDHLEFRLSADAHRREDQAEVLRPGMKRFRVQGYLGGKPYGSSFGLDVLVGESNHPAVETLQTRQLTDVPTAREASIRLYPRTFHLADKLRTMGDPSRRSLARVKDLVDIGLLAMTGPMAGKDILQAVETVFQAEGNATPPANALATPPTDWTQLYERLHREDRLPWASVAALHQKVVQFLGPVFQGAAGTWDPAAWAWR